MSFVLPAAPSFGTGLIQALSQAGTDVAKGIQQRNANAELQKLQESEDDIGVDSQGKPLTGAKSANKYKVNPQKNAAIADAAVRAGKSPEYVKALTDSLLKQQELQDSESSKIRLQNQKRQSDIVEKQQAETLGQRETINRQRHNFKLAEQAVKSGEVGGFDKNYLANLLGPAGEPLKTLQGATLESAMKDILLSDVTKVTGQKNQWIEQQLKSALPSIGKQASANEALIQMSLAKLDIQEKWLDTKESLISEYEKRNETPPSNIDQIVNEMTKDYAQQREDQEAYDLRVIYEKDKGQRSLRSLEKVPKGTPLTIEKRDALMKIFKGDVEKVKKKSKELGYTIPKFNPVPQEEEDIAGQ